MEYTPPDLYESDDVVSCRNLFEVAPEEMALPCKQACKRYLLHLAQEHIEFRLPEIKSLLSLNGAQFIAEENFGEKSPFWILNISSEEAARGIMKRTVCAKSIFELWGYGKTHEELYTSLKKYPVQDMVSISNLHLIELVWHSLEQSLQPDIWDLLLRVF